MAGDRVTSAKVMCRCPGAAMPRSTMAPTGVDPVNSQVCCRATRSLAAEDRFEEPETMYRHVRTHRARQDPSARHRWVGRTRARRVLVRKPNLASPLRHPTWATNHDGRGTGRVDRHGADVGNAEGE